jgi:uncharacterized protein YndB with AHSA1/START domain
MEAQKELIRKSISIHAPKEKVWDVLFTDRYIRIWYAEFSQGSYAVTDWKVGSKAFFMDESKKGLVGVIAVNEPNQRLAIEYAGVVSEDGSEDYESEIAREFKGARETYHISEEGGNTFLELTCDMSPKYFEMMSTAWDKALQKIKQLSEE